MAEQEQQESETLHTLKNHLGIVVGFSDLLLLELDPSDRRYADLMQIRNAGRAALDLVPELTRRMRPGD